jgi:glycosyltransferase involved in cell wall biosynthesis
LDVSAITLVSVIVPAFNGERTILKTISSIIKQRSCQIELMIIDDGSKDSTFKLVENFLQRSVFLGNYLLVRHDHNLGLSKTLNDGVQRSQAEYVLILHQDCELVCEDWISKALLFMNNKEVAIVTGYYGLSESSDESFVKRSFGVLRKQFHSRPEISCEEATFSEGKCDLYRRDYLKKIGNFPINYRIAGEDLVVSYKLRKTGLKILKCYDLPVVQRFTGKAETFTGNLGKEFLFGKALGGVFSQFKFFIFKSSGNSKYSNSRSLHRATQPVFVFSFFLSILLSLFYTSYFMIVLATVLVLRYAYYVRRTLFELRTYNNRSNKPLREALLFSFIGILTDFFYSFGFISGLVLYRVQRRL